MTAFYNMSDEEKMACPVNIRKEAQALTNCTSGSKKAMIDRIPMQRFFGTERHLDTNPISLSEASEDSTTQHQRVENAKIAVIETVELLAAILSYLPTVDLVIATRVHKSFRKLIFDSPALRRILFLELQK